jgi:Carboxypeptidase regulatory-like domain
MARFVLLPAVLGAVMLCAAPAGAQELQLSLSVQQTAIVAPNPVRATLQFHNSGQQTIWLYRPVGDISQISQGNPMDMEASEPEPNQTFGGPTLEVHLAPSTPQSAGQGELSARGAVILTPGLPHPKLIALRPGSDYAEKVVILIRPARPAAGEEHIAWGQYRFAVTYSARYSNQDDLVRNLGINLWHEPLRSNEITLDLRPPAAQGSIEGIVLDSLQRAFSGTLVTLSNGDEEPLYQVHTDIQGRFSFSHLAWGRYWLTVRRVGSPEDDSVFRHVDLDAESPRATARLMMIPAEIYEADRVLHKPVLFRVVDGSGQALAGVALDIVQSTGNVMEKAKTETNAEGYAAIDLMSGQNFVTLRKHGCHPEERRADVAAGGGIDGFKFEYDCSRK